ncbi:hypothetical protein SNE40_006925 [Patella caerulea]|uniref:DNA 3'-5' helicase n=1 Tax=Patella caerulea TaxID=87958 RepID=A0AAN8JSV7_PATCE
MDKNDIVELFEHGVKKVYNFDLHLKTEQIDVIHSIINSKNVLGVLPTGFGKSLCYTLPPLILDEVDWTCQHISLVVSPLIALMKDQVISLNALGVKAGFIGSEMTQDTKKDIHDGKYSVIFTSPEALVTKTWRSLFLTKEYRERICLFCCDEAHCISEWGDDFRPDYKRVSEARSFVEAPVLCLTATCTEKILGQIFQCLGLSKSDTIQISTVPDRPNIYLKIEKCKQEEEQLDWVVDYLLKNGYDSEKIIIYCRSVKTTAQLYFSIAIKLQQSGIDQRIADKRIVDMFHKSLDIDTSNQILDEFKKRNSHIRCLIATIAFGMGIQIPDVKLIVNWGAPKSLLTFWQEVGRAGRDGRQSLAVCYAYPRSFMKSNTDEDMINLISSESCYRFAIMGTLTLESRPSTTLDYIKHKRKCDKKCITTCKCSFCMCCSFCYNLCPCDNKINILREYFY